MASNGLLELTLLNTAMNGQGVLIGCDLRFYTHALVYGVRFGPSGSYNIEKYNRFLGYWESVMFSGTYRQTISTLVMFGPFLTLDEISQYWDDVVIPPENPNGGFLLNPI